MSSKWLLSKWGRSKSPPSCHKYKWLDIVCNKPSGENYMICCCSYAISHSELIYFHWQGNLILQRTLIGERGMREIVNQAECACACARTYVHPPLSENPGSLPNGRGGPCGLEYEVSLAASMEQGSCQPREKDPGAHQGISHFKNSCQGMKIIKIWTRAIQTPKTGPLPSKLKEPFLHLSWRSPGL